MRKSKIEQLNRDLDILRDRLRGSTYQELGQQYGMTRQGVSAAAQRAAKRVRAKIGVDYSRRISNYRAL